MNSKIIIVSLGPGSHELLTLQAAVLLLSSEKKIIFRTENHPVTGWLAKKNISVETLDHFYEEYDDFFTLNTEISKYLWSLAQDSEIIYAVMDPETDTSVMRLFETKPDNSELIVIPGMNVSNTCLSNIEIRKNSDSSLQTVTATDIKDFIPDPSKALFVTEIDSTYLAAETKLQLSNFYEDEISVYFFFSSNNSLRKYIIVPLYQIDSMKDYSHTTALYIPGSNFLNRQKFGMNDLENIVNRLRSPNGCPWDRVQTHESLRQYIVEEAWEVVASINEKDSDHLADELGDVLYQIFIHASIAEDDDEFTLTDIISCICQKMIRRHPNVFKQRQNSDTFKSWEELKQQELSNNTVESSLNEIPESLPALKYATKLIKKLAVECQLNTNREYALKILNDLFDDPRELNNKAGILLMICVLLCYQNGVDAEIALHEFSSLIRNKYKEIKKLHFKHEKSPESLTIQELCVYLLSVEEES